MSLVLDASAVLAWMMDREDAQEAHQALELLSCVQSRLALVPALWLTEVINGVIVAERRSLITTASAAAYLGLLETLPIELDRKQSALIGSPVLSLARAHNLTAYDATYLELALRTNSALATFDRKLAQAARAAGVPIFGDS